MHDEIADFTSLDAVEADRVAAELRILADPTRVKILWALAQGESSVGCLAEISGATPTAVSQHLSKLRLAGVVRSRRQGNFQYYTVADPGMLTVLEAIIGRRAGAAGERDLAHARR